jgi:hypothetical protein
VLVTFKGAILMKLLRVVLFGVLVFIALTVVAFIYLPWWQALIVVLAMILAIVMGVRFLLRNLGKILSDSMLKMFEVKSQVLRGAQVQVNSVQPTTAPADTDDEESEAPSEGGSATRPLRRQVDYFLIDVTIKPAGVQGPMQHWDLDDLRVVPFDTPAATLQEMAGDDAAESIEGYDLRDVKVMENHQFVADQQGKYEGPRQISAVVGVPSHVRELKFQYYGEQFGHIKLPPPLPTL